MKGTRIEMFPSVGRTEFNGHCPSAGLERWAFPLRGVYLVRCPSNSDWIPGKESCDEGVGTNSRVLIG